MARRFSIPIRSKFEFEDQRESLQELVDDIDAGRVELLVIIGGNPVLQHAADLKLTFNAFDKHENMVRVHLSEYKDETSEVCHWHVPAAHYLESWGDTRSYDGTVTIMQPLIEPLYDGKTRVRTAGSVFRQVRSQAV